MTDKVTCELFIAMNEDGGWIVTTEEGEALAELGNQEGGYLARVVKITAKITPPVLTEAQIDIPDEAGETKQIDVEAA